MLLGQTGEGLQPLANDPIAQVVAEERKQENANDIFALTRAYGFSPEVALLAGGMARDVEVHVEYVDTLRDNNGIPVNAMRSGNTVYLLKDDLAAAQSGDIDASATLAMRYQEERHHVLAANSIEMLLGGDLQGDEGAVGAALKIAALTKQSGPISLSLPTPSGPTVFQTSRESLLAYQARELTDERFLEDAQSAGGNVEYSKGVSPRGTTVGRGGNNVHLRVDSLLRDIRKFDPSFTYSVVTQRGSPTFTNADIVHLNQLLSRLQSENAARPLIYASTVPSAGPSGSAQPSFSMNQLAANYTSTAPLVTLMRNANIGQHQAVPSFNSLYFGVLQGGFVSTNIPKLPSILQPFSNPAQGPVIPSSWVSQPGRVSGSIIFFPPGTDPSAKGSTYIRVMPPGATPVCVFRRT